MKLPGRRSNAQLEPTSPLGIALRRARVEKQLPQRVIAVALAERCGGEPTNVRVSGFELGRRLPTDAELTVLAQVLGLSVQTLRGKREASREHTKIVDKAIYEQQIATGKKKVAFRLKPRHPAAAPVPVAAKAKAPKAKPAAAVPALADLVEQIDGIAPMPVDRDARRLWFRCVSELSRMAAS